MAYANEKNAGHLLISAHHGSSEFKGVVGGRMSGRPIRDPKRANGHIMPVDRSVVALDASATIRFLDQSSVKAYTTAAANVKFTLQDGAGNQGDIIEGLMVPGDWDHIFEQGQGGMPVEQTCDLEGTSFTHTTGL